MKAATRRNIFVTLIAAIIIAATIYGFLPKKIPVDLYEVSRGPLRVTIEEEGRTRLKDRFIVSSPVSGYMMRNNVKVGDSIRRGQVLVLLQPLPSQPLDKRSREEAEAAVSAAEAGLKASREREKAAQADREYLEKQFSRMKNLYSKKYVAKDQFDQADSNAQKARAAVLSATAAVDVARFELERAKAVLKNVSLGAKNSQLEAIKVPSPIDGTVLKVYRESEGPVQTGEPLVEAGDLHGLEVRVEVLSSDAVKINRGTRVLFERWGGEKTLEGVVRRVEPAGFTKISSLGVEEQRTLVIVDIVSPAAIWNSLGDGFRLEANFIIWEKKDILQVPAGALFRSGENWAVFVAENGRARLRTVKTGQRNGLVAEIISGLREHEMAIVHPDDAIKDGVLIKRQKL
jgi:HlyD family secretion protein